VNGFFLLDQDATPREVVRAPIFQHDKTITEEVHLLSKDGASLPWIVGIYYFDDLSAYDPLGLMGSVAAPLDQIQIWSAQKSKSYAAFGQVTVGCTLHEGRPGGHGFDARAGRPGDFVARGRVAEHVVEQAHLESCPRPSIHSRYHGLYF
jgi:hypothetical protein